MRGAEETRFRSPSLHQRQPTQDFEQRSRSPLFPTLSFIRQTGPPLDTTYPCRRPKPLDDSRAMASKEEKERAAQQLVEAARPMLVNIGLEGDVLE